MGSERDRAIADAVRKACADLCARVRCRTWDADECALQIRDDKQVDLDAIIAAVTAQHPAPALPGEVAMRIAEEVRASIFESADECAAGWFIPEGPPSTTLAAIVSRHLPTDEEREAERAVVEAALAMRAAWTESPISAYDRKRDTMHFMADRLLAIRAKRGAR